MITQNKLIKLNIQVFFLVLLFFVSGYKKYINFDSTVSSFKTVLEKFNIKDLDINIYKFIILLVVIFELLAPIAMGLSINEYIDKNYSKICTILLIIFTILATILYHNPLIDENQLLKMLKNLSIIGGFLCLYDLL